MLHITYLSLSGSNLTNSVFILFTFKNMASKVLKRSIVPSQLTDAELVVGAKKGDRILLTELYNRYASKIYYKCLSMVKDKELAQDMAHDVFIKVSTNLIKFKGASELSFWIYAITYNHCISYLKKSKRLQFDTIDERIDPPDEGAQQLTEKLLRELQISQLKKLMKLLKPEEEVILLMRYQDGMSIKQIATILQIGESAVKMRLKRCREHLAELFKAHSDE